MDLLADIPATPFSGWTLTEKLDLVKRDQPTTMLASLFSNKQVLEEIRLVSASILFLICVLSFYFVSTVCSSEIQSEDRILKNSEHCYIHCK